MIDYIGNLIARNLKLVESVQPKPVSMFETLSGDQHLRPINYQGSHRLGEERASEDAEFDTIPQVQPPMIYRTKVSIPAKNDDPISQQQTGQISKTDRRTFRKIDDAKPSNIQEVLPKMRADNDLNEVFPTQRQSHRDQSWRLSETQQSNSLKRLELSGDEQEIDNTRSKAVGVLPDHMVTQPAINSFTVGQLDKPVDNKLRDAEAKNRLTQKKSADETVPEFTFAPTIDIKNAASIKTAHEPKPGDLTISESEREIDKELLKEELHANLESKFIPDDQTPPTPKLTTIIAHPEVQSRTPSEIYNPHEKELKDESPHTVNVTIGRIEVRAVPAPKETVKKERTKPPVMSLDEYLRQRAGKNNR